MEEQDAAMEIIAVASEGMVSLSQALESAVEVFKLDESSGVTPHPVAALPGAPRKIPSSGAKERGASTPPKRR
jgi:hypothetical protein